MNGLAEQGTVRCIVLFIVTDLIMTHVGDQNLAITPPRPQLTSYLYCPATIHWYG